MDVLIILLASAVAALIVFGLGNRTPRCPRCRVATTVIEDEMVNAFPAVFECVYRCPQCGTMVRKRAVEAFGD